jgi:hypothetical protein
MLLVSTLIIKATTGPGVNLHYLVPMGIHHKIDMQAFRAQVLIYRKISSYSGDCQGHLLNYI